MLKMPTVQMRTKYPKHLDPESNLLVQPHRARQLLLHHLGHTKLEFDVPTKVGERYTSRACCLPTQSNEVRALLVQSLLHHCELHLRRLLQVVQPLQTIAWKVVVQQSYRSESNGLLRECKDAFQKLNAPSLLAWQQLQRGLRSDPFHQIQFRSLPSRRVHS